MGDIELGEIGDHVLFENEKIRIWEMCVKPGEASPWHHHQHDYVVVVVEGDRVAVEHPAGEEPRSGEGYGEVAIQPGDVVFLEAGATEIARNTGKSRYRDIQIELK
ncbi:MAG: hypothetical protein WD598_00805 [Acidimicrobiia bacterium]